MLILIHLFYSLGVYACTGINPIPEVSAIAAFVAVVGELSIEICSFFMIKVWLDEEDID